MFVCEECKRKCKECKGKTKKGRFSMFSVSNGRCEMCGNTKPCYEQYIN